MSDAATAPKRGSEGDEIRERVAERYGALARRVLDGEPAGPGSAPAATGPEANPVTRDLYTAQQSEAVPAAALVASLGCGNPAALADLEEGQVVLDLGSGGGIDVLLSARRVGPTGTAYGLDMSGEMLELARENQRAAGIENVEFLEGTIEAVPLPDETVDVIISNCVINLSPDKPGVFREAFRVLRPGGRFAVSDIVIRGELDPAIRQGVEAWLGCVVGALEEDDYRAQLEAAGFVGVDIEPTRVYTAEDAGELLDGGQFAEELVRAAEGQVVSAFVRASKP